MPGLPHGRIVTAEDLRAAQQSLAADHADNTLVFTALTQQDLGDFDYMFPTLQSDPEALLPESAQTVAGLRRLAATMGDDNSAPDSTIPAAYTYFGQFVDHDITLETQSGPATDAIGGLLSENLAPMPLAEVRDRIRNARTGTFDLDSVYDLPAPRDPEDSDRMLVGEVTPLGAAAPPFLRPKNKGTDNDVPRTADRTARIGDPRNDENTIISQLQVAFLKAHNRLVDQGHSFEQARRILRQHYQYVVLYDFLPRIVDEHIVDDILAHGNRWYDGLAQPFYLPLEFGVAAYRFGHTMVRADYDFNSNFRSGGKVSPATLGQLFTFTALSGTLGGTPTLPENWIIEWENLIGDDLGARGHARRLDTTISARVNGGDSALLALPDVLAVPDPADLAGLSEAVRHLAKHLATRNLLRGYLLRMPSGQAVAAHLGLPALTRAELTAAVTDAQAAELANSGFLDRTPLWFYLLAEAAHHGGNRLGPVGGTIVAEVLIGLVRRSEDSILRVPGWMTSLPAARPGAFDLADLLRFAGVLGAPTTPLVHVVEAGDSLFSIAAELLGDGNRWPEIFAANRTIIRRFDQITPGMRLTIPAGPPPVPQLRFVIVEPGDTLSDLARTHLGDPDRWPEIFDLNRDILIDPDVIVAGQVLQIPGK